MEWWRVHCTCTLKRPTPHWSVGIITKSPLTLSFTNPHSRPAVVLTHQPTNTTRLPPPPPPPPRARRVLLRSQNHKKKKIRQRELPFLFHFLLLNYEQFNFNFNFTFIYRSAKEEKSIPAIYSFFFSDQLTVGEISAGERKITEELDFGLNSAVKMKGKGRGGGGGGAWLSLGLPAVFFLCLCFFFAGFFGSMLFSQQVTSL